MEREVCGERADFNVANREEEDRQKRAKEYLLYKITKAGSFLELGCQGASHEI